MEDKKFITKEVKIEKHLGNQHHKGMATLLQEFHLNNHKNRKEFIYLYCKENKGSKKKFNEHHLKGCHMVVNPTQFEVLLVPKKGHESKLIDERKVMLDYLRKYNTWAQAYRIGPSSTLMVPFQG